MVELLVQRRERSLDVGKVDHPARLRPRLALDVNGHVKRVTVEPSALVIGRDVRQPVRGLERELLEDRDHGMPRYLCVCTLNRQRGCARQYSMAAAVCASRSGPSIGCRKKCVKSRCS